MSRWSWWAVGLGAYIAFTLARFPAATALDWLAPRGVVFTGVAGTLWSGSVARASIGELSAEALRWQVRPASLLLGRIAARVEARIPDGFVSTDLSASPSSVSFSELRAGTSLSALAALLPIKGMGGQASIALESLVLENGWPTTIVGELKLARLETVPLIPNRNNVLVPIGDYTVTFVPAGDGRIAAEFVDDGGPLEVSGTLSLDATRAYTIDALAKPRPGAPEMLVEGLRIMTSEPDAEGRRRLSLTGSL